MENFFGSETTRNIVAFFQNKLTLIDFMIIGLGIFLLLYQTVKRLTLSSGRFYRKAQADALYITRTEVTMGYIGSLIELLPILGLLGTVWGLMNALAIIANQEMPSIKDIATYIAPAISTTFFGLVFAVANLLVFNFLQAYLTEVIAWCRQELAAANLPATSSVPASEKKHEKAGN